VTITFGAGALRDEAGLVNVAAAVLSFQVKHTAGGASAGGGSVAAPALAGVLGELSNV
jgi:hypothetical protein